MANIILAASLVKYSNGGKNFQYDGTFVDEVLLKLCKTNRELGKFIFSSPSELHPFINIFIDSKNVKQLDGLNTKIEPHTVIRILPGISGG